MHCTQAYNIDDLHRIARSRLPKVCDEFMAKGTEDNVSLRNHREIFERIRLQPRILLNVSKRAQQVTIHGKIFKSPFGIAPTGAAGLYGFDADVALSRASRALDLLRGEVDRTMGQLGVNSIAELSRAHLVLDETYVAKL